MKHSKEELEAMSDFDINVIMAHIIYSNLSGQDFTKHLAVKYSSENSCECIYYLGGEPLDYCNNPLDMMHLVFDLGIELSPLFCGEWSASHIDNYTYEQEPVYDSFQAVDSNPLRAAAIVYILIKQGDL